MQQAALNFCAICAPRLIESWQGWPNRNAIPRLPKLVDGACQSCGSQAPPIESTRIVWFNYHSDNNTGLPDYWLLQVDGERLKWGLPYFAESACAKCGATAPVSQMQYPNGTSEFKVNCASCGVRSVR